MGRGWTSAARRGLRFATGTTSSRGSTLACGVEHTESPLTIGRNPGSLDQHLTPRDTSGWVGEVTALLHERRGELDVLMHAVAGQVHRPEIAAGETLALPAPLSEEVGGPLAIAVATFTPVQTHAELDASGDLTERTAGVEQIRGGSRVDLVHPAIDQDQTGNLARGGRAAIAARSKQLEGAIHVALESLALEEHEPTVVTAGRVPGITTSGEQGGRSRDVGIDLIADQQHPGRFEAPRRDAVQAGLVPSSDGVEVPRAGPSRVALGYTDAGRFDGAVAFRSRRGRDGRCGRGRRSGRVDDDRGRAGDARDRRHDPQRVPRHLRIGP